MPDETTYDPLDHLTDVQIERYRAQTLKPEVVIKVTGHVAACDSCRQRLAAALPLYSATKQMLASLASLPEIPEEHLDDEVLSAYTDMRLDDVERELVEMHLAECAHCRTEVEQLRSLLTLVQDIMPLSYQPSRMHSVREKMATVLEVLAGRRFLQTAGFALATGLVVFFITRNFFHAKDQTALYAQWNSNLQARKAALDQQEQLANEQLAQAGQRKQQIADAKKLLEQDRKKFDAEKKQLALSKPQDESLPDPLKLTYASLPSDGVTKFSQAGDNSDPLPFALCAPLPGATVLHDRVVFRWDSVSEKSDQDKQDIAQSYQVELTDVKGVDGKATSLPSRVLPAAPFVNVQTWKPDSTFHLLPGRLYTWKVIAYRDKAGQEEMAHSPQIPVTIAFRTLDLPTRKRLQAVPDSALRLSIALAQAGLLPEAKQTLENYLLTHPQDTRAQAWRQRIARLQADWLRQVEKRLQEIPNSTGAQEMQAQLAAELPEK